MQKVETQIPEMRPTLSKLLGAHVNSIERVGGGRNSRIYRITCEGTNQYVVKFYFKSILDGRDRLKVEFSGLQFLWESGIRCIPRPIVSDRDKGYAIYEYIAGKKIASEEVKNSDLEFAVQFLTSLKELKNREGSRHLPIASEACFSIQAIVDNIDLRLRRLSEIRDNEPPYDAFQDFLRKSFTPAFDRVTKWCQSHVNKAGVTFGANLEDEERTLSPSDFGFHNALRRDDGQIVFLDFEYFGWDDPAKMVADVLLHPGMNLSLDLKREFAKSILYHFKEYPRLADRVGMVYPLFGLKWCLILLNEFLPDQLFRRQFASVSSFSKSEVQISQLAKSKQMLQGIMEEYESFPYFE